MDTTEGLDLLARLCHGKDWFYQVGMDSFGRYVVYTHYMSYDILRDVPDTVSDRQVLVHFVSSKLANRNQFTETIQRPAFLEDVIDITNEAILIDDDPADIAILTADLDRLEKTCGSHIMQDIFYEVHDGTNAVTNLSAKFPEVRESMEKLYAKYGFDVIYEEMDG
jgi:hypothetical protein